MQIIKSIIVSFSMYSKIPMPRFNWDSKDMKYSLSFFPLVGLIIGLCVLGFYKIQDYITEDILRNLILLMIPFVITGGFHLDGFMDTMDALSSYGDKEKKLSIMKDPHVGSFSIMYLLFYLCLMFSFVASSKIKAYMIYVYAFSFITSRAFSALGVTYFPKAKKEGMVYTSYKNEGRAFTTVLAILFFIFSVLGLLYFSNLYVALVFVLSNLISLVWYYFMTLKEFGGVNGDTQGFFVCVCELVALASYYIYEIIGRL